MDFDAAFEDINSPQSLEFIKTLMQEVHHFSLLYVFMIIKQ